MYCNKLFRKMFITGHYFTIAIKKRTTIASTNTSFLPNYIIPANRKKWYADPMLVEDNGKTYLFCEAVLGDHGHIEVFEVKEDCTLSEPSIILSDECHYSYPFVFQYDNVWYMIPESSCVNEVRLYEADRFPYEWHIKEVLLNKKAVDTTVFTFDDKFYLLTFYLRQDTERVIPHAFELDFCKNGISIKEVNWLNYNELKVRGAGPLFIHNNKLYRPAQDNQDMSYGDGVIFYESLIRTEKGEITYREKEVSKMLPKNIKAAGYCVDGLHTYCCSDKFETIDIRCGELDFLKSLKKVFRI